MVLKWGQRGISTNSQKSKQNIHKYFWQHSSSYSSGNSVWPQWRCSKLKFTSHINMHLLTGSVHGHRTSTCRHTLTLLRPQVHRIYPYKDSTGRFDQVIVSLLISKVNLVSHFYSSRRVTKGADVMKGKPHNNMKSKCTEKCYQTKNLCCRWPTCDQASTQFVVSGRTSWQRSSSVSRCGTNVAVTHLLQTSIPRTSWALNNQFDELPASN